MELIFLGTGSMMPTKERAQTAIALRYLGELLLFDCGEGTQRQLRLADLSAARITKIFLSHWHGDHFFGLPGLLESMAKTKERKIIDVYGPKGTKAAVGHLTRAFFLRNKIVIRAHEIVKNGVFLEEKLYRMNATKVKHGMPCLAYTFEEKPKRKMRVDVLRRKGIPEGPLLRQLQEGKPIVFRGMKVTPQEATYLQPGKKITILLDTVMDKNCVTAAKGADVLVCESTFHSSLKDKAKEYYHLTAEQAGMIAKRAQVKKLVLTHFSQRYKDVKELEQEAKKKFQNTVSSYDFMKLAI